MNWDKKTKSFAFTVLGLFVALGSYNALVINSESYLADSQIKFVKRLDEMNGVVIEGRKVATVTKWQKLAPVTQIAPAVAVTATPSSAPVIEPAPAVQQELTLSLVEVINPKKWQQGLSNTHFSGSLSTNNGVIEDLSVSLPDGEGVTVYFSEMTGNVFEYTLEGELYSGMMYQVDQNSFMVTLTNGPLEGTRLRFSGLSPELEQNETQARLAEYNQVNVGNFGDALHEDMMVEDDQQMQKIAVEAQSFNLTQSI
ncbi:MAG: hypothetical protein NDI69_09385 [Bacteriovoracaceae bacterium]|nr:hypothetical protein [Bacteriovoracaceae bacterium]